MVCIVRNILAGIPNFALMFKHRNSKRFKFKYLKLILYIKTRIRNLKIVQFQLWIHGKCFIIQYCWCFSWIFHVKLVPFVLDIESKRETEPVLFRFINFSMHTFLESQKCNSNTRSFEILESAWFRSEFDSFLCCMLCCLIEMTQQLTAVFSKSIALKIKQI